MGGRQGGYKGVECQSLEKDIDFDIEKPEPKYIVRGYAHVSNSGNALNILIKESDGKKHLMSVSKRDLIDIFKNGGSCSVIEYVKNLEENENGSS